MFLKPFVKPALMALILCAPGTTMAQAADLPPLEQNARIMNELVAGEVGYQIQKHCDSLGPRRFRALGRLNQLGDYARSLGYTDADFRAVSKDKAARARRDALVDAYLAKNGVHPGEPESYCRLGRAEIEKNSLTGWLLYEK